MKTSTLPRSVPIADPFPGAAALPSTGRALTVDQSFEAAWAQIRGPVRGILGGLLSLTLADFPKLGVADLAGVARQRCRAGWLAVDAMGVSTADRERWGLDAFHTDDEEHACGFRELDDVLAQPATYGLLEAALLRLGAQARPPR
jgi:hypothetical protein